MKLGAPADIIGTYQGVWPGIAADGGNAKHAGPTSSAWIDTSAGFCRHRAFGATTVVDAMQPPEKTSVTTARYLQVIAEAAVSGALGDRIR
jgi:hypothetical protein